MILTRNGTLWNHMFGTNFRVMDNFRGNHILIHQHKRKILEYQKRKKKNPNLIQNTNKKPKYYAKKQKLCDIQIPSKMKLP